MYRVYRGSGFMVRVKRFDVCGRFGPVMLAWGCLGKCKGLRVNGFRVFQC